MTIPENAIAGTRRLQGFHRRVGGDYMMSGACSGPGRQEGERWRLISHGNNRVRGPGPRETPLGNRTRWVHPSDTDRAGWVKSLGSSRGGGPT
jgi:hypothetical protein